MTENVIVCGVDGSDNASRAAVWAADWAQTTGRSLKLVTGGHVNPVSHPEKLRAELEERIEKDRATIAETHSGLEVTTEVDLGSPVTALLRESKTADAVVIGTKGTGGWKGLQGGSVSGSVAAQGFGPTVVVPMQADATFSRDGDLVVGYDGLTHSVEVVTLTFEAAQRDGRKIRVVRSVKDGNALDGAREEVEAAVARIAEKYDGVETEVVVDTAEPADLMARESQGSAMTILESRGYGGIGGFLLGPTATALIQTSHSPVLILTERSERSWPHQN